MATIINNPGGNSDSDNGSAGWIVAIVAIVILGLLGLWLYSSTNADETEREARTMQEQNNAVLPPPVNNFNTTVNSTTTINNSTTTEND